MIGDLVQDVVVKGVPPREALSTFIRTAQEIYAKPENLVYKREPIEVESIDGDMVNLTAGPAAGTKVVTQGASELWGFEFGIGK